MRWSVYNQARVFNIRAGVAQLVEQRIRNA